MKKYFSILFLTCLTITISCQNNTDYSKTLEEYYEAGVPSINSEWTDAELKLTILSLKKLRKIDSFPLPKLKNNKSSLLFKKITSEIPSINVNDSSQKLKKINK